MRWWQRLAVAFMAVSSCGASCGQSTLGIMPWVFNDSEHRTLRRDVVRLGLDDICPELLATTVPLKLRARDPSTGRFFPTSCDVAELGNEGNLFVTLAGHGYAWNDVTGRLGFEATVKVELEHDFLLDGATMYLYLRARHAADAAFTPLLVERAAEQNAPVTELLGTDMTTAATEIGRRVLLGQVGRGFTAIRTPDGTTRVGLGLLAPGTRPFEPFGPDDASGSTLANDRTELHVGEVDFTGPFDVDGEALWLTALVEGAPSVDVLVYAAASVAPWIAAYERRPDAAPAPRPAPLWTHTLPAAPTPATAPLRVAVSLPPGRYVVVFDHSARAGPTTPSVRPGDDRAALVSYALQRGAAP
ncbi:MAG: hypothetical protein AAF928_08615 [Myxococcota bacterium]